MSEPNTSAHAKDLTLQETSDLCFAMQKIARNDPMAWACLTLLLRYGLRRGELLALRLEDIGTDYISIPTPMSGHCRRLPVSDGILMDIHHALNNAGPILKGPSDLERCVRTIRRAAREAGIQKGITVALLRKTGIVNLRLSEDPGLALRRFSCGQGSSLSTRAYTDSIPRRLEACWEALSIDMP